MSLIEVRLFQEFAQQSLVNTFHFLVTGGEASESDSFATVAQLGFLLNMSQITPNLFEEIRALQTNQVTYREVQAINPYDPTDFFVGPVTAATAGLGTAASLSPAVAMSIRSNRVRTDIRRGFKRFGGIGEGGILEAGVLSATKIATLQAVCDALNNIPDWTGTGNPHQFQSVVVSKNRVVNEDGSIVYKYYPTYQEQLDNLATNVVWSPVDTVRTQVSRQYGRGS